MSMADRNLEAFPMTATFSFSGSFLDTPKASG